MGEFDWLEEHEDKPIATRPAGTVEKQVPADKRLRKPAALIRADRDLSLPQRVYRDCLVAALSVKEANEKFRSTGWPASAGTLASWRKKPGFAKALRLAQEYYGSCLGISKDKILYDLELIYDDAVTPRPQFWKGEEIPNSEKRDLTSALKAKEQQAKVAGLHEPEQPSVTFALNAVFGSQADPPIDGEYTEVE